MPDTSEDLPRDARGRRMYSEAEVAQALAALELNEGNVYRTSEDTGIPRRTLEHWRGGQRRLAPAQIAQAKDELARAALEGARKWGDALAAKDVSEVSAKDCAVIFGIMSDKFLVLNGEATSITEHRNGDTEDRLAQRIHNLFGNAIPITDAQTVPTTTEASTTATTTTAAATTAALDLPAPSPPDQSEPVSPPGTGPAE